MREALAEAEAAGRRGEVPVGAVVIDSAGRVIGRGSNRREERQDPLAHAEVEAIQQAAAVLGSWRLEGCTVVVTLEPCAMCAGALVNARVARLVFGAFDPKAGWCGSLGCLVQDARLNHRMVVESGILAEASGELLRGFFRGLRKAATEGSRER
jgi:tRNA(adenine34) deaminase